MKLSFFNFFRRKKQKKATEGPSFPQWNRPSGRRNRQSLDNDHAFSASAAHEHSRRILTLERDRGALKRGQRRSRVLCLAMVLFVGAIILQLVNLQFVQKDFLAHWALNQISGENLEIVPRGSIVDRNGEELAVSVVSRSLAVNPQELVDDPDRWPKGQMPVRDVRQVAANRLSPILQMPASKLMELFTDKQHMFFWVKRTLDPHVAKEVSEVLDEEKIPGFHFIEESKRYYPKDNLAAQVIGFVGIDDKGLEGVEASMDTYRNTAAYLKNNPLVIVKVIEITFIQRMALFAVTWFVYQAFGLHGTGFWDILFLQAVISVSVDMLPLPGGMGISETLFLKIFPPVFGSALLLPAMVLSRGLGYYGELLVSAVFTIVAQLTIGNTKREKRGGTTYDRVL